LPDFWFCRRFSFLCVCCSRYDFGGLIGIGLEIVLVCLLYHGYVFALNAYSEGYISSLVED
jgi:hypothetical protein